ncbi:MAG: hypothetical protein ACYTG6_05615 [Planctomycetota bacterium]|jgi:hypothetical protein
MHRIVVKTLVTAFLITALGATAWAGPDSGSGRFGFQGRRPLVPSSSTGIARPTPAPRIRTSTFGFARVVPPPALAAPAPTEIVGTPVVTYPAPVCRTTWQPTRRIATDALSVPAVHWSSGYHDGAAGASCAPCVTPCDPCAAPCADPCPPRVIYRTLPGPCYAPVAPCWASPPRAWAAPTFRVGFGGPFCGGRWGWGVGWGIGWGGGWGGCW